MRILALDSSGLVASVAIVAGADGKGRCSDHRRVHDEL